MATETLYWHDYETWGRVPAHDRPAQFAGQRTTVDLEPVGEPDVVYIQPPTDRLPDPEAVAVTGLLPQDALARGMDEAAFAAWVEARLGAPGTCGVGWNNFRFDDEVTRTLLYRDLRDPYAREWRNGNSRLDLIEVARLFRALRPEGVIWPDAADGRFSFRLQDLMTANHLAVRHAHEALSDVESLIALARLMKRAQPGLWNWCMDLRSSRAAMGMVTEALHARRPLLHIGTRHGAASGGCGWVLPIGFHPEQAKRVILVDLAMPPETWRKGAPEAWAEQWLTWREDESGAERAVAPFFSVPLNRLPTLVPAGALRGAPAWPGLETDAARRHAQILQTDANLLADVHAAYRLVRRAPAADAEGALYDGFLPDADRARAVRCHRDGRTETWRENETLWEDARCAVLAWRRRVRVSPESASDADRTRLEQEARSRLTRPDWAGALGWSAYLDATRIEETDTVSARERKQALRAWGEHCAAGARLDAEPERSMGGPTA